VRAAGSANQTAPMSSAAASTATAGTENADCTTVCPAHPPSRAANGGVPARIDGEGATWRQGPAQHRSNQPQADEERGKASSTRLLVVTKGFVAEGEGFEPPVALTPLRFSRPAGWCRHVPHGVVVNSGVTAVVPSDTAACRLVASPTGV